MTDLVRPLGVGVLVLAVLWFLPSVVEAADLPAFYLVFAYFLLFWVAQSTSWALTSGYAGYFSFGQGAFIGTGVYATAILTSRYGWNFLAAVLVSGLCAGLLALGTGAVAFRLNALRGEVFALLTLFVSLVVASMARAFSWIDGGQGVTVTIPDFAEVLGEFGSAVYRLALVVAVATVLASRFIYHSRLGWSLFAVRDDEEVAEGLGVKTFRAKLAVFTITGFISGVSGGLHSLQLGYISINDVFNLTIPLMVILMAILGGKSVWYGPALGAAFIFGIRDRMTGSAVEEYSQILLGVVLVLAVLFVPEGLGPRVRAHRTVAGVSVVLGFLAAVVFGLGSGLLDQLVVAMVVSAASVLLWPVVRRRRARTGTSAADDSELGKETVHP